MIVLDICLSDIPKDRIKKSEKNNKSYASIIVDERKEPDQYGNTHTLYMGMTKEEREAKSAKQYVGSGKEYVFSGSPKTAAAPATAPDSEDLPF